MRLPLSSVLLGLLATLGAACAAPGTTVAPASDDFAFVELALQG